MCCLSSLVHLPHANMIWQIYTILRYEIKQIFYSCMLSGISATPSPCQYELTNCCGGITYKWTQPLSITPEDVAIRSQSRSRRFSAATPVNRSRFARRSSRVWLVDWRYPQAYFLALEAPLIPKRNADEVVGIFRKCWPCATLARSVGRAANTV